MKRKLNFLVIFASLLFFILLVKAEDDDRSSDKWFDVGNLSTIGEQSIKEPEQSDENPEILNINDIKNKKINENLITNEGTKKIEAEDEGNRATTVSFGVYLNIVS